MNQSTSLRILYIFCDYLSTLAALLLFVVVRFHLEPVAHMMGSVGAMMSTTMVRLELLLFPLLMLFVYWLTGYYNEVIMKSRLQELLETLHSALVGMAVFFLIAMINDVDADRFNTYKLIAILAAILFSCTYLMRVALTTAVRKRVADGRICRHTLIVGTGPKADSMYARLKKVSRVMGFQVEGFVSTDKSADNCLRNCNVPVYTIDSLKNMIASGSIQTLVVISDDAGINPTLEIINKLLPLECDVLVDAEFYQKLSAPVRTQNIIGEPLVDVSHPMISGSTANIKRFFDVAISAVALLLIWPFMLVLAFLVRMDSPGPAIYRQERIGRHKKPFTIYKFRSMYINAESAGPSLSSPADTRITPLGRRLRKYRLDELPQLWNVLRGDMSLVGPRPEREYFIRQIVEKAPSYTLVQQVRPGLTSWGMVKFGYASTVDQMVQRLRYELMYIDNISILLDFRIIIYTIKIVLTGKGI